MSYYGKLCTIMYDLDKPFLPKEELLFYRGYMSSKDINILEPMCGSGRFYVPILKEGYKIDGFDISKDMLQACIDKCEEIGISPKVFQKDITNFEMNKKYDLILIPFGSICLIIDSEAAKSSLINIYNHLEKDGIFLVSFLNKNAKTNDINEFTETKRKAVGEDVLIEYWNVKYEGSKNLMDYKLKYQLVNDDKIIEEEYMDFPIKLYQEEEFAKLLKEVGFNRAEKVSDDGNMIVFECRKG